MLKLGIQAIENTFCISEAAASNCQLPSPGKAMITESRNTAAVTMSVNIFMASVFSRGKKASANPPIAGKKTIRLSSIR